LYDIISISVATKSQNGKKQPCSLHVDAGK
jgi:hypothetical protein